MSIIIGLVISFLITAVLIWILAMCFGFMFTWKLALGVWVIYLITITGGSYDFITTVSMKKKQDFDTEAMEKDGVLDKYMTETEKPEYRFTPKKHKD